MGIKKKSSNIKTFEILLNALVLFTAWGKCFKRETIYYRLSVTWTLSNSVVACIHFLSLFWCYSLFKIFFFFFWYSLTYYLSGNASWKGIVFIFLVLFKFHLMFICLSSKCYLCKMNITPFHSLILLLNKLNSKICRKILLFKVDRKAADDWNTFFERFK